MKKNLPPKTHYQRIENRVSNGMCDTFLCHDGKSVFVELKQLKTTIFYCKGHKLLGICPIYFKRVVFFLVKHLLTSDLFLFGGGQAIELYEKGCLPSVN